MLQRFNIVQHFSTAGSFIFLAIEGGASQMQQRTLASTNRQTKPTQSPRNNNNLVNNLSNNSYNMTLSPAALQDVIEVRDRCVENIWDVTVSLNVLYRENWTRYVIFYKLTLFTKLDSC
jgi:potassium channel subfamily K member 18